jgi:ABC-type microcin C transport system permease subunit YejB
LVTIDTAIGPFCIAVIITVSFLAKNEYLEILPITGVVVVKEQFPTYQSPKYDYTISKPNQVGK